MSTTLAFYRFSKGAKKDLIALNNNYTYADIVGIVKSIRKSGDTSTRITSKELVIRVKDKMILGVSLQHLPDDPRVQIFQCEICFDSHSIKVADECDYCDGEGCKDCTDGFIFKQIACPNCTSKNILRRNNNEWSDSVKHKQQQRNGNRRRIPSKAPRTRRSKAG